MPVTEQMVNFMIDLNTALESAIDNDYSEIMDNVEFECDTEFTSEQSDFCRNNYAEYAKCFQK